MPTDREIDTIPDEAIEAAARILTARRFADEMPGRWLDPADRDRIVDEEWPEDAPTARTAIVAYLLARAELADKGPIGAWPRMLRALAAEVERQGGAKGETETP